jgi:hypothetical protein
MGLEGAGVGGSAPGEDGARSSMEAERRPLDEAKKVPPIWEFAKIGKTQTEQEGATRTTQRERRKIRRHRFLSKSLDFEIREPTQEDQQHTNTAPETKPELDPDLLACMQSDPTWVAETARESPAASSPGTMGGNDGQDEDDAPRWIDETRLQAELGRKSLTRNQANEERLTMWDYAREKQAREEQERAEKGPNVPETEHERLEFLAGPWKGRGTGTKAWWWKPMPTAAADHISLAIRRKATLSDRLILTYAEKAHRDKDTMHTGYGLSAAARKAAAREAEERERYDTIQYLTELKSASVEREESHRKDVRARRLGKLRQLAAQVGRRPCHDLSNEPEPTGRFQ